MAPSLYTTTASTWWINHSSSHLAVIRLMVYLARLMAPSTIRTSCCTALSGCNKRWYIGARGQVWLQTVLTSAACWQILHTLQLWWVCTGGGREVRVGRTGQGQNGVAIGVGPDAKKFEDHWYNQWCPNQRGGRQFKSLMIYLEIETVVLKQWVWAGA